MKIIQFFINLCAGGVVTYTNECYKALKLYGCEVKQYNMKGHKNNTATTAKLIDCQDYENTPEQLADLNSADYVFLHSMPSKNCDQEYTDAWYDLVINKITTKKVLFFNAQKKAVYRIYNLDNFKNRKFLNSIDYYCMFSDKLEIADMIKETIGKNEFHNKYIHLQHPMEFEENCKNNWIKFEDKYARCSYIGRFSMQKYIQNIISIYKIDTNKEFDYEMRGIVSTIAVASTPDIKYEFKKVGNKLERVGPSKYTFFVTNKWKKENGYEPENSLIDDFPHKSIYVFGEYPLEEGLYAMKKSMFGIECFHIKNKDWYGNNIEYAMFEIIKMGSIPIFDRFTGENIYIEDDNGIKHSLVDLNLGLFLDKDCSNINDIFSKMVELKNNKKEYDAMRNRCWKYYKKLSDPLTIATNLVNDLNKKQNLKNKSKLF